MLNVEEEDGWESSDEESDEENEEEVKEEEAKPLTKKERQRLYHQKVSVVKMNGRRFKKLGKRRK